MFLVKGLQLSKVKKFSLFFNPLSKLCILIYKARKKKKLGWIFFCNVLNTQMPSFHLEKKKSNEEKLEKKK
jgi:hypothetical protein